MSMRLQQRLAIVLALAGCGACVSLNPSAGDVTGRWQVECEGGKETLDLKPDGHYVYAIKSPSRHMRVEGAWKIEPPRDRTDSTHIVLQKAPQSCHNAVFLVIKDEADNWLRPVWEWGRTELSFDVDADGFRRIKSD